MNQKLLFHPAACVIQPRMGAKIINAKYCEELKIGEARPRSFAGNHEATIRPLPGNTGACASPASNRKIKITVKATAAVRYPAKPVSRAHTDHPTMARPYTRFDPKRSSIAPEGNCPST